jgi:hypothetical protein
MVGPRGGKTNAAKSRSGKDRIDLKPPAPLVSVLFFVPH